MAVLAAPCFPLALSTFTRTSTGRTAGAVVESVADDVVGVIGARPFRRSSTGLAAA